MNKQQRLSRKARRPRAHFLAIAVLLPLSAGGCGDGSVRARGHLLIEGEPAGAGRLSLAPIGGGKRCFSAIGAGGEFDLRGVETSGAMPGQYTISFRGPLDGELKSKLERGLKGKGLSIDELSVSYRPPQAATVTIPETGSESLEINIRSEDGWRLVVNE